MGRKIVDELDRSLTGTLRNHSDRLDFDNSRIVRSDRSEKVTSDRRPQIGSADERLHDILGENERREIVLDVVVCNVNMLKSKRDVGRGNGSNPPVRLTREYLLLVLSRRDNLNLVSSNVGRSSLNGGNLVGSLGRLFDLSLNSTGQHMSDEAREREDEPSVDVESTEQKSPFQE